MSKAWRRVSRRVTYVEGETVWRQVQRSGYQGHNVTGGLTGRDWPEDVEVWGMDKLERFLREGGGFSRLQGCKEHRVGQGGIYAQLSPSVSVVVVKCGRLGEGGLLLKPVE